MPGTVTLYGASDDLIEVEGEVSGCDEYPGEDEHFVLIGDEAKSRVRVWYTRRGVWAVAAAPVDEGVPMLPLRVEHGLNHAGEPGYSAKATVEGVRLVIHEASDSE